MLNSLPLLLAPFATFPSVGLDLLPEPTDPLTIAEASGYTRSSRLDDVVHFLDQLEGLPNSEVLTRRVIGRTTEGRDLVAVTAALPGKTEVRHSVIVNATIHGGEIEGKAAVQILLREFALGRHHDLLEGLSITFIPVYNADGNDRISRRNRVSQNGPVGGVGQRPNAMGLDLNRDFVKVEAPETRALMKLCRELEPIAFMDLHTTNGSPHGYDLTYAPSLSPNAHPGLDDYVREQLFPSVRAQLEARDGVRTFDYGILRYPPRERGSRGKRGTPIAWNTYDSRPRFGTNLMGLRGTLPILSEAYSYLPYKRRVEVTYAFTLECLRRIAEDRGTIAALRAEDTTFDGLAVGAKHGPAERLSVRVGSVTSLLVDLDPTTPGEQTGRRNVASPRDEASAVEMDVNRRFSGSRSAPVGRAWAIPNPSKDLLETLEVHLGNLAGRRLAQGVELPLQAFAIESAKRNDALFQGHREVSITGSFEARRMTLPAGTLILPSTRLTAHLLHPESDDSLATWNAFDQQLFPDGPASGTTPGDPAATHDHIYPVLMLEDVPGDLVFR